MSLKKTGRPTLILGMRTIWRTLKINEIPCKKTLSSIKNILHININTLHVTTRRVVGELKGKKKQKDLLYVQIHEDDRIHLSHE